MALSFGAIFDAEETIGIVSAKDTPKMIESCAGNSTQQFFLKLIQQEFGATSPAIRGQFPAASHTSAEIINSTHP